MRRRATPWPPILPLLLMPLTAQTAAAQRGDDEPEKPKSIPAAPDRAEGEGPSGAWLALSIEDDAQWAGRVAALGDPDTHCPHASPSGGGVCVVG